MSLVTFLIPVYNEIKTVEKAIKEIVNLDYDEKEIIIIDNNSNDGSKSIIKKFENYKNIKTILKDKNLGFGDSIKKGFELSKGEFIYIQYADLEYHISGFNIMLEKIKNTKADIVFGERYKPQTFYNTIRSVIKRPAFLATLVTTKLINYFYNKKFNDIIGTKLYKSEKIKKININSNGLGFDFELISVVCKKNFNIERVFIPYEPRSNSKDKKIKFYHMSNALYQIFRIKFTKF